MERSDGGDGNHRIDRPLSGHQACEDRVSFQSSAISIARLMLAGRATLLFDPQLQAEANRKIL
jgi:hypothetical protein